MCIHKCTVYKYKNRNATLYRCTTLNFDNLKELIQFILSTPWKPSKLQRLLFQHNHRENSMASQKCQKCMYYVSGYSTSEPQQLSQVNNQFISDKTLRDTVQCFTQRKVQNKPSSNPFKLHARSDPEVFSRSLAAAAAEALTMGRFGFLTPSETSLSRQLWAYSLLGLCTKISETKQRRRLLITLSALCAEIAWVQIL